MTWPKQEIIIRDGQRVSAQMPIIVSASRSTDVPAFYADWFMERLKAGYVKWYNPFNGVPHYVSLPVRISAIIATPTPITRLRWRIGTATGGSTRGNDYGKMGDAHRSLAVLPKRDEFRADRTLDGLLKDWLKHLPKPEYDDLIDEDDDLSEPPLPLPDFPSSDSDSLV